MNRLASCIILISAFLLTSCKSPTTSITSSRVWEVSTIAGGSGPPEGGSGGGLGSIAKFNQPYGVAVDSFGNVYVADKSNHSIRKITASGRVTFLAGSSGIRVGGGFADGRGSRDAKFKFPTGVAVYEPNTGAGIVYVADNDNHKIRTIRLDDKWVGTLAGGSGNPEEGFKNGAANAARFEHPNGVAVDGGGNIYVADNNNHSIRKITKKDGTETWEVTTIAGKPDPTEGGFADGSGNTARFKYPSGVAVDSGGNIYVADTGNHCIRKITSAGVVSTIAGRHDDPAEGDFADGPGSTARFKNPSGVAVDGGGNIYVADTGNHRIRKITSAGVVSTIAGTGRAGSTDGFIATARFDKPIGVAVDGGGVVYVADQGNHCIRKLKYRVL